MSETGNQVGQTCNGTLPQFQHGENIVDFVLAYENESEMTERRKTFERNLKEAEGLIVESESSQGINLTKIHVPPDILARYCEIMRIKIPIAEQKISTCIKKPIKGKSHNGLTASLRKVLPQRIIDFLGLNPQCKTAILYEYSREKGYLFEKDPLKSIPASVRTSVAHYILNRTKSGKNEGSLEDVGLTKLLKDGVYQDAYPLHLDHPEEAQQDGKLNQPEKHWDRQRLLKDWASMVHWIKLQPLNEIKDYFGENVAMYFAWQGFYTNMLIWASGAGLLCLLYGLVTFRSDRVSQDICKDNSTIMCPQCDKLCDFWRLGDTCTSSRLAHLFDNNFTIFFAFFMSVWASVYLKMWKRYSSYIQYQWGVRDYDAQVEPPRPQYLARLRSQNRKNPDDPEGGPADAAATATQQDSEKIVLNTLTGKEEPAPRFWTHKLPSLVYSYSVILLFIGLAVAAVFGFVIYRMSMLTARHIYGDPQVASNRRLLFSLLAAVIDLALSIALDYAYNAVAVRMTNIEYHRTENEYNESLNLKIYLFQFVNYYSSIFYIAFLKGKFPGYPAKYNRILGFRQEECDPGGCLMELCIQLATIMIGKQTISLIREFTIPFLLSKYREQKTKSSKRDSNEKETCRNLWTNYSLSKWTDRCVFDDYVKMVIQYGFITIFVVAFPLAPVFALVNNVFETRLDAKKYLQFYKRSIPKRVRDIGMWYDIMDVIARIAVVSSAFIIAFSSHFIPRMVYMSVVGKNHSDEGFLNHSLARFAVKDFQQGVAPLVTKFSDLTECRYQEYRNPPGADRPYKRPLIYWHIFAFRFAFIVIYQNVVSIVQGLVSWVIPDTPTHLREQIKREQYAINQFIISEEKKKVKEKGDHAGQHQHMNGLTTQNQAE